MDYLVQAEYEPHNGPNVYFGETIVFTHEGKTIKATCMGWRLDMQQNRTYIKTDKFHPDRPWQRWDVPVEEVKICVTPREARIRNLPGTSW